MRRKESIPAETKGKVGRGRYNPIRFVSYFEGQGEKTLAPEVMPRQIPFEILPSDCSFKSIRSRGPGGQNVNKTSTAVQLFFSVKDSSLPQELKDRIAERYGRRMTSEGVLSLKAQGERTQELNRRAVLRRLREMIERAAVIPEVRRPTRPTRASQKRRLEQKAIRSSIKRSRAAVTGADE